MHGMVSLASYITNKLNLLAGILNPSDVLALRNGTMGVFWDEGEDIALEEVLAVQTTLLLQHVGINPSIFTPENVQRVEEPDGLAEGDVDVGASQ